MEERKEEGLTRERDMMKERRKEGEGVREERRRSEPEVRSEEKESVVVQCREKDNLLEKESLTGEASCNLQKSSKYLRTCHLFLITLNLNAILSSKIKQIFV